MNHTIKAYLFDEDFEDLYLVAGLPVEKEYYVDEGFYVLNGQRVIYACPECGDLVSETKLYQLSSFIPDTDINVQILERQGIDLGEDMLLEALECYEKSLSQLELEPFSPEMYLNDPDAFQYVVDFGHRQAAYDVAEEVEAQLLEEVGNRRLYLVKGMYLLTSYHRVVGEYPSYEEAKKNI